MCKILEAQNFGPDGLGSATNIVLGVFGVEKANLTIDKYTFWGFLGSRNLF